VDFKNSVIIMTSNIGSQWIRDLKGDDAEMRRRVMEAMQEHFRPEFLNRIDETIIFNSLGLEEIKKIVDLQIERLKERLRERKLNVTLTDRAKEFVAEDGFDPTFGARPLRRTIEKKIQNPLALKILEGDFSEGDTITVDLDAKTGDLRFSKA
jgi:ATP-dependent Clp protease ATP-binding subunit ClpB